MAYRLRRRAGRSRRRRYGNRSRINRRISRMRPELKIHSTVRRLTGPAFLNPFIGSFQRAVASSICNLLEIPYRNDSDDGRTSTVVSLNKLEFNLLFSLSVDDTIPETTFDDIQSSLLVRHLIVLDRYPNCGYPLVSDVLEPPVFYDAPNKFIVSHLNRENSRRFVVVSDTMLPRITFFDRSHTVSRSYRFSNTVVKYNPIPAGDSVDTFVPVADDGGFVDLSPVDRSVVRNNLFSFLVVYPIGIPFEGSRVDLSYNVSYSSM